MLREITCYMESHSVICHPAVVTFLPLPQPKLVLDLAILEGCKAELTCLRNNRAVSWLAIEPATKSPKFNVRTTTPPSTQCYLPPGSGEFPDYTPAKSGEAGNYVTALL